MKTNKFYSSTAWQVGSKIYTMLLSLLVGALTARYLGPSNYGLIGYGSSLIAIFIAVSNLGMNGVVQKELIDCPENRGELLGTAFCMRFVSSALCMLAIDILVRFLEPGHVLLRKITWLQSFALLLQIGDTFGYWFQSRLEHKVISIGTMLAFTVVCVWRVFLLVNGAEIEWFAASSCVQYLASSLVLIVYFARKYPTKLCLKLSTAKRILKSSYHFIFSGIAISLYTQVDKIMLGRILNEEMVGYYTAATTISALWEFVPMAVINSAMVLILNSKKTDEQKYNTQLSLLLCGITVMGIVVSVVLTVFGKLVIRILYGEAYMLAYGPLIVLLWSTCFAMIGSARGSTWILAEKLNMYSKYYVFISSALNLLLNAVLIPKYGIMGAAVATLVSQITTALIAPLFFKRTRAFVPLYIKSWAVTCRVLVATLRKGK